MSNNFWFPITLAQRPQYRVNGNVIKTWDGTAWIPEVANPPASPDIAVVLTDGSGNAPNGGMMRPVPPPPPDQMPSSPDGSTGPIADA